MDPLSAAASVIAVVQIADRIITVCKAYITGVQDAPVDLRMILIDVGSVKCVLETLELLGPYQAGDCTANVLEKLKDSVKGCSESLKSLETLFPSQAEANPRGKRQRIALSLNTLAWPFKRDKAKRLLEEVARHKARISLSLTAESVQDLKYIRSNVDHIRETTDYSKFHRILDWLVSTDPSTNHNSALELHEDHTGQWLTNSPEYANWKDCSVRFIWLHGIPGAGKTVLLSYIAEDIRAHVVSKSIDGIGWAYYYCYFGRAQDETPHLLRWVVNQLCRQINGMPSEVKALFDEGTQPTASRLVDVLAAVSKNFSCVYLVVDALDESSERDKILNFLLKVIEDERLAHIQLLVVSRKEVDIERAFGELATDVSLSNPYVDEDIKTYIQSYLRRDRKLSRWPYDLLMEVEDALVKGAQGMFRWVVCQLDILRRLDHASKIRAALSELPETLDETYERILLQISPKCQNLAYRTLLILSSGDIATLRELDVALTVDVNLQSYNQDNRQLDIYAPVELCTCLVTYEELPRDGDPTDAIVRLAHYTVKEYLMSSRIRNGRVGVFHMSEASISSFMATCFIVYMLQDFRHYSEAPLMHVACYSWEHAIQAVKSNTRETGIWKLVLQLLDPSKPHFKAWIEVMIEVADVEGDDFPVWSAPAGAEACLTLAYITWFNFPEAARLFFESHTDTVPFDCPLLLDNHPNMRESSHLGSRKRTMEEEDDQKELKIRRAKGDFAEDLLDTRRRYYGMEITTVMHLASAASRGSILEVLISRGADPNIISGTSYSMLTTALDYVHFEILPMSGFNGVTLAEYQRLIELLLSKGTKPAATGVVITPLQSITYTAVDRWDVNLLGDSEVHSFLTIFRSLLASGADPNGVGDDNTNIERIRRICDVFPSQVGSSASENESDLMERVLHRRGRSKHYDTPLRLLQSGEWRGDSNKNFRDTIAELLKSHGAKSLHLFPVEGLPGYAEEDMKEWAALKRVKEDGTERHNTVVEPPHPTNALPAGRTG